MSPHAGGLRRTDEGLLDSTCPGLTRETPGVSGFVGRSRFLGYRGALLDGRLLAGQLLDDPARTGRVDAHAGPHRRRERDRAQVTALRRCRLGADELVDQRRVVLEQLALVQLGLADREV